jgi:hypothetical protein
MLTAAATKDIRRHSDLHSSVVELQAQNRSVAIAVSIAPGKKMRAARNFWESPLTGRSDVCSELGARRPLTCSGLGVAVPPPCSEFIELLTLLEGVEDCCTAPFSFMRPFELLKEDCDPATPFEPSLVPCALSAFFLLLKRNAIVPFEAGNLLCYANLPRTLVVFVISRNLFRLEWEVRGSGCGGTGDLSERSRVRLGMAGDLRSEGRDDSYTTSSRTVDS